MIPCSGAEGAVDVAVDGAGAADVVFLSRLRVTGDVVEERRTGTAAGAARREVDRDLVARDEPSPAAFVEQIEKSEAALDRAVDGVRCGEALLAGLVEYQPDETRRTMVAPRLAARHHLRQLGHAVGA